MKLLKERRIIEKTPFKVLQYLNNHSKSNREIYAMKMSRKIGSYQCHVSDILKRFENAGVCKTMKPQSGRRRPVKITKRGKWLYEQIYELKEMLEK